MDNNALIVKCVAHILDELLVVTKDKNQIVDAWPAITLAVRDLSCGLTGDSGDHIVVGDAVKEIIRRWADQ